MEPKATDCYFQYQNQRGNFTDKSNTVQYMPGPYTEDINNMNEAAPNPPISVIDNYDNRNSLMPGNEQNAAIDPKQTQRKFGIGLKKKSPGRDKTKKIRRNRQLRKILMPKNALMALNELKGVNISDMAVSITPDSNSDCFVAELTVDNIQYKGMGTSKMIAKNMACENALRDIFVSKLLQKPIKVQAQEKSANTNVEPMICDNGNKSDLKSIEETSEEDEVPMTTLASFALHKLFSEWHKEGFEVPEFRKTSSAKNATQDDVVQQRTPQKQLRTELPPDWEAMSPTMLLGCMRSGFKYEFSVSPTWVQFASVTIDDQIFTAEGKSKKSAKRNVAVKVCNQLFNTNYSLEE